MRKILALLFTISVIFMLGFSCVGANGNPTEVTGTWEYKFEDNRGTSTDETTITLVATDQGTFTITYETDDGVNKTETEITGTFVGDVWTNPKTLTFTADEVSVKVNGTPSTGQSGKYTDQTCVTYSILYISGKTYLNIIDGFILSQDVSGKYEKK